MPRGVYDRPARAATRVSVPAVAAVVEQIEAPQRMVLDGIRKFRSANPRDMAGQELRDYAAQVGVSRRDIEALTEDRLRQNVSLRIMQTFELLGE